MTNTNLHITRAQAESLLKAVRYEHGTLLGYVALGIERRDSDARLKELRGNETMLLAALSRLDDLERKRAPHLRVATYPASARNPW